MRRKIQVNGETLNIKLYTENTKIILNEENKRKYEFRNVPQRKNIYLVFEEL